MIKEKKKEKLLKKVDLAELKEKADTRNKNYKSRKKRVEKFSDFYKLMKDWQKRI